MVKCEVSILANIDLFFEKERWIEKKLKRNIEGKSERKWFQYHIYLYIDKNETGILLYSEDYKTRAVDLMNYLCDRIDVFSNFIIIREQNSVDNICSYCMYKGRFENFLYNDARLIEQLESLVKEYNKSTEIIDAKSFYEEQKDSILIWNQYKKIDVPRCFVSVESLRRKLSLKDSDCIIIKTLENDSGISISASENKVIMIGVNGESYDMPDEKFDELYKIVNPEVCELTVSRISSSYEMQPRAVIQGLEEVNLLNFAEICQSRKTNTVYACKKRENVKVFSTRISGTNQYYYGNGEKKPFYLTVDKDSPTSVHVVDQEVFEKSYELVKL